MAFDWNVLWNQLLALVFNLLSWVLSWLPDLPKPPPPPPDSPRAVQIDGPGGLDRLKIVGLSGRLTVGYNVPGFRAPYAAVDSKLPRDCVILNNQYFR